MFVKPCSSTALFKRVAISLTAHIFALWTAIEATAQSRDASVVFDAYCANCHISGVLGAPRLRNEQDWAPRIAKGEEALYQSVLNGLNAMPPRGACPDCTDDELRSVIPLMSGASFESPNNPKTPVLTDRVKAAVVLLLLNRTALDGEADTPESPGDPGTTPPAELQVEVLTPGSGPRPTIDDSVLIDYVGSFEDGTVFDSSLARGLPVKFRMSDLITGLQQGLQLMPVGATFRFRVPPELAYGEEGAANGSIPPNATLIFEVTLIQIS